MCLPVDKAFPELCNKAKEELALYRFLAQLKSPQISLAVRQHRPKSIREAAQETLELESYSAQVAQSSECHKTSLLPVDSDTQPINQLQCLTEALQQLHKRLLDLESVTSSLHEAHTNNEEFRQQPSQDRKSKRKPRADTVICRKCKQPGHLARGCALGYKLTVS